MILLDVLLPDVDGFEVCRRLKQDPRTQEIPIIFMTAMSDTEHKIMGFAAGGVDYLTKPVQAEEVLARGDADMVSMASTSATPFFTFTLPMRTVL